MAAAILQAEAFALNAVKRERQRQRDRAVQVERKGLERKKAQDLCPNNTLDRGGRRPRLQDCDSPLQEEGRLEK